jgi:hypothetical protein
MRKVKRDIQIMIRKGEILLRVENFKKGSRRIASNVLADLVHLIEHENGIRGLSPPDLLNDPAWKSPDIGPAVSPDLCLIPDPS